jgi:hypothetical protein
MRKLWVKAWMTLDGVFDADTMGHWWNSTNNPERMQYIMEQYSQGDVYLLGRTTYEMLWPGWSTQTTGDGPGPMLNRMKKICGLCHARSGSLERIHHHQRKCGGRNHQTETAARQRHYYRWQCYACPIADGY